MVYVLCDALIDQYTIMQIRYKGVAMYQLSAAELQALQQIHDDLEATYSPYASRNADAIREYDSKYDSDLLRSQYSIDIDKIIHSYLYNRGNDKTQVFSIFKNDDITRRSSHVQLVSRIARIIGRALRLNLDLIEAIAIGHDVGHTPFCHKGEDFLNAIYHRNTGRYFNHNVHSVRVLQKLIGCNLTLQTLDGILCHCGEKAFDRYEPDHITTFEGHREVVESCYTQKNMVKDLRPSTLEGCVVRISDMIAYLGKDRQDAKKAKINVEFSPSILGLNNPDIISNIITDIVSRSMDQPYLSMSADVFSAIEEMRKENNDLIYQRDEVVQPYFEVIQPMMELLYERFLTDLNDDHYPSVIYKHHLNNSIVGNYYRHFEKRYIEKDKHDLNDIVVDFIASMTDDYFIDVFRFLFPDDPLNSKIKYIEYFDPRFM